MDIIHLTNILPVIANKTAAFTGINNEFALMAQSDGCCSCCCYIMTSFIPATIIALYLIKRNNTK